MSKELNKAPVEQAGGDERDFQAKGAQEVPSPVSQEYDRHLISLLRKGEALPGHQEEAADEIERLRDWNDHLNNTVLPNILNPNFLMLMKGGERLLDLCTKDGEFIGVSLNDMKDVFDWMVTHARIAPDQAALAQPSPMRCLACGGYHGNSGLPCPNMRVTAQAQPSPAGVQLSASRERRIYIAGPMTGYKDCNFPAFNAQAEALRGLGYHVENPADHGVVDGAEWQDYLRYDISRLSTCEAIFLLPGWSKSKGAALEVYIAKALGMTFIHHADAEREQPSPVQPEEAPVIGCLCGMPMTEGHHSPDGCSSLEEFAPHLSAQAQAKQAERPEVTEVAFVLRNIGAMDAEDIDGDNVDLRFEDAEGRDTGCDVSIVEYAEKAADLLEQHDRIVGALRAKIAQLRQHKNDYMDAGQETYRALQNEIREREAEIARLDGLVSGRTAERDAALARVAELERGKVYVEARQCDECQHGGINDSATGVAACHECDWTGPEPEEDRCPGCQRENCMAAACPQCGARYVLVASEEIAAPVAQAQHSVPELLVRAEDFVSGKEVPQAWLDVQAERRRQITAEGWTPEHDDLYCAAELPRAAAAYILNGANDEAPAIWPFSAKWWKPRDARSNYVRASALILAEIERLDRAAPGKEVGHE
ncbi:DUF4406 domain-containing protein [Pseudomonas aeruginosa]|uniref:DUF4406 domain-containing protein n=1 Tax=Pseudomonas aeruginosa TaxID=287 RepID=UPI0023B21D6F|nr:DUF4406 domain-containing protein [Pseudomonas aeruginosa]MDE9773717.1 DUF4406 domain-containing protein [Pseudomonas aeruginosa]